MKLRTLMLVLPLLAAACAAPSPGGASRCFPASSRDLLGLGGDESGRQLICGTSRLKPSAREEYRARYPQAFGSGASEQEESPGR